MSASGRGSCPSAAASMFAITSWVIGETRTWHSTLSASSMPPAVQEQALTLVTQMDQCSREQEHDPNGTAHLPDRHRHQSRI